MGVWRPTREGKPIRPEELPRRQDRPKRFGRRAVFPRPGNAQPNRAKDPLRSGNQLPGLNAVLRPATLGQRSNKL